MIPGPVDLRINFAVSARGFSTSLVIESALRAALNLSLNSFSDLVRSPLSPLRSLRRFVNSSVSLIPKRFLSTN